MSTDVIQIARDKRRNLMREIEDMMAEVEKLDEFIRFGKSLTGSGNSDLIAQIAAE